MSELLEPDDSFVDVLRGLSAKAERKVRRWIDDLNRIYSAPVQAKEVKRVAAIRECHVQTVYNKIYAVRDFGLYGLLDKRFRDQGKKQNELSLHGTTSPLFRDYVGDYYRKFDRNNGGRAVYDQILSDWRRWIKDPYNPELKIPGYEFPPDPDPDVQNRHPRGWSKKNIAKFRPSDLDLERSRRGPQQANLLLAPIRTTRYGLKVGQIIMFDDQEYDNYVMLGNNERTRPLGLMAIDVLSGKIIGAGYKPKQPNEAAGEKKLNNRDSAWFLIYILTVVGYRTDEFGTQIVSEAGTASVSNSLAARIAEATNHKVSFNAGEVSKEKVRGLKGLAKGNPRHKPGMESIFNLVRNTMGFLPAPTGRNKDEKHEGSDELLRQEKKLLDKASQFLPNERLGDLNKRVLPWDRFVPVANAVNSIINADTEHNLEAWKKLGFETIEYQVGTEYCNEFEFENLPPETQELILLRAESDPAVLRSRKLSREEAFRTGEKELKKLDPFRWHLIIDQADAIRRKIPANGELTVTLADADPEPIIFETWMTTPTGDSEPVPPGLDVLVYLNPFLPDRAILCDSDRVLLGLVMRSQIGCRADKSLMSRQFYLRAKTKKKFASGAARFDRLEADRRERENKQNAAILSGESDDVIEADSSVVPSGAKKLKKGGSDLDDFCPPESAPEEPSDSDDHDVTDLF